ncbi:ABC transporter substrate-binding protein [Streptomyces sp. AD2-2]|nr:ABC transporter substrate-binding protein [Streptomyces sp. AD2-2]
MRGEAAGSSAETSSLKGTPVKVMVWAPENTQGSAQPGIHLTAEAYQKWINANGGIKGGPLKVEFCNEKGDPDEAEKCAQQAVADKVAAVVGSYSLAGDRYMPVLQKAGIPYIGGTGVSAAEFSNPLSFPVNGGTPVVFAAHGRQLVEQGCKKITGVRYDVAAAAVVSQFLTLGVTSAGGAPPKDLKVPLTATDLAPQVAATKGSDCVSVILGTASGLFVKSYVQSGDRTKLASVVGNLTPQLAASTGGSGSPWRAPRSPATTRRPPTPSGRTSSRRPRARPSTPPTAPTQQPGWPSRSSPRPRRNFRPSRQRPW